jgi:hypothetical protein
MFTDLKAPMTGPDPRTVDRLSVLDVVRQELAAVRAQVGTADRRKIDAHSEAIRTLEHQLSSSVLPPAHCEAPTLAEHQEPEALIRTARQQMDILALSLACDLTRVGVLTFTQIASGERYSHLGISEAHHTLGHLMGSAPHAEQNAQMVKIAEFQMGEVAYLIEKLKSIPEGNGSVFDNTVILVTNEHARSNDGNHLRSNLPYLLAGRAGGYFRSGRFVTFNAKSHHHLLISLCHAMGLTDVTTFGNPGLGEGPLAGLT